MMDLKEALREFMKACLRVNLTYDIIFDLKYSSKCNDNYSKDEKTKINQMLIICENCIDNINKAFEDIILCLGIR